MGVAIAYHAFHGVLRYENAIIEREVKYFAQSSIGFYDIWACSHLGLYAYMDFCHWAQDAFGSYYSGVCLPLIPKNLMLICPVNSCLCFQAMLEFLEDSRNA